MDVEGFQTTFDGFGFFLIGNEAVEIGVIPELGAKIATLKDRRTGREWIWRDPHGGPLRQVAPGVSFADSNPMGIDECLPTISPCIWKGRTLPDHGEAWSVPWHLDHQAWKEGRLRTTVLLATTPLEFSRVISLSATGVQFDYTLTNRGTTREEYLWAIHPLFALQEGDRLELPSEVTEVRIDCAQGAPEITHGTRWSWPLPFPGFDLSRFQLGKNQEEYVKAFAGPFRAGWAAVTNSVHGGIRFQWDANSHDRLGLWLTRGGYHGWHHFALEPTNGAPDSLVAAVTEWRRFAALEPGETTRWGLQLDLLGNDSPRLRENKLDGGPFNH